eukprot:Gb_30190 [translate_table: standard]
MATLALAPSPMPPQELQCPHNFSLNMNDNNIQRHQRAKAAFNSIFKSTATATYGSQKKCTQQIREEWQGNNGPGGISEDITKLCREGRLQEALGILQTMDQRGISVDSDIYGFLLEACGRMKALVEGKRVHDHILASGLDQNVVLSTKLVTMYAICGSPLDARLVFDCVTIRNVFLWNAMISGYVRNGLCEEALALYRQMEKAGIQKDEFTFPCVLKACANLSALQRGKEIHDHIIKTGLESDIFVGNALVTMYAKCDDIDHARHVFDKMSQRSEVSWNAMIAGYAQNGHANEALTLFCQVKQAGIKPDTVTFASILPVCADLAALEQGKEVHGYIIKSGIESDVFVGTALIDMYAKCGSIENARLLFDQMYQRNVVSWNAIIAAYAQQGRANDALKLFRRMQLARVEANTVTVLNVLPAFSGKSSLKHAKEIHEHVIKSGFESDVFVGNALVAMYVKCETIELARHAFDKLSYKTVGSWNAMIAGYAQSGHANVALKLFLQMQLAGMKPDAFTIGSVLLACAHLAALQLGKEVHDYIVRNGFESDVFVGNALVAMYAKCGSMETAKRAFDKISHRNVVSWNTMIAGFTQNGNVNEALKLFRQMQMLSMKPDSITLMSVLPACSQLAALQQGKEIHCYMLKCEFELDVFVGSAIIDTYAKCGNIDGARKVFDKMLKRDAVSWTVMIAGYGMHGQGKTAITLFNEMQQVGMKPDHITFVSVLSACSHAGLVDEGWQYFYHMIQDYLITPSLEHYACMVDLLGRAGHLEEALNFIKKMPVEPDAGVWGALLGACRIHCDIKLGEHVAQRLIALEPNNAGNYVLLSNIHAAAGRWDDVAKVRALMKDRALKKNPGCSWIEVKNRLHAFLVGDKSHPQSEKIYGLLDSLDGQMKEAGYVPDTNFVLHDVEEEEKEHILYGHSEKLAIAYGILNTCPGMPLRITKNLRVCGDCHTFTKFITKIVEREIIVRDANRFHHFKDGLCSCGDYW